MKRSFKITLLALQVLAWSMLLAFPYLNKPPGIDHFLWSFNLEHFLYYFFLISFFNLNYFYFIPYLFQKQRFFTFFNFVIFSFIIIILSRTFIVEFLFPKREIVEFRFHFSAAGYLIVVYAISTAFRALQDWFTTKREKEILISEKQKAELAVLRHQLSPHFLFNTLNNITELMHKDVDIAEEYVGKLSALLRDLLQKEKSDKIKLMDELNFVKNYVDLQKIRLNENNNLSFHIVGDAQSLVIEPFILINFVENVFKHGLGDNNKLVIHIKIENGSLQLITENGISKYKKDESGGIGLANIKKRLQLIYQGKYELQISASDKYYVNLKIDLA